MRPSAAAAPATVWFLLLVLLQCQLPVANAFWSGKGGGGGGGGGGGSKRGEGDGGLDMDAIVINVEGTRSEELADLTSMLTEAGANASRLSAGWCNKVHSSKPAHISPNLSCVDHNHHRDHRRPPQDRDRHTKPPRIYYFHHLLSVICRS